MNFSMQIKLSQFLFSWKNQCLTMHPDACNCAVLVGFNRDIKTSRHSTTELLTQPHSAQGIRVGNFATVSWITWCGSILWINFPLSPIWCFLQVLI